MERLQCCAPGAPRRASSSRREHYVHESGMSGATHMVSQWRGGFDGKIQSNPCAIYEWPRTRDRSSNYSCTDN